MRPFSLICLLAIATTLTRAQPRPELVENLTEEQAARYERFDDWLIRGVCGTSNLDLAQRFGINTIRGYTINIENGSTKKHLDEAHRRGMMMVVSEWMPHQGENSGRNGAKWNFDYTKNVEQRLENFLEKFDALVGHPAILMWGLGNEVHLDPEYLEYVNLMSEAIHERDPLAITSLTMINAKPQHIELIKIHAPDLDVIGVQSYSPGAVRGAIRNMEKHWAKPYYFSEFNGKGPWNFEKTDWGTPYDNLPEQRVEDLIACYDAIESAPRSLGSTAFVWGHFTMQRASYFSLLLSPHPTNAEEAEKAGIPGYPLVTPYADAMGKRFLGTDPLDNRAPLITALETTEGERQATVTPGGQISLRVVGQDPDGDTLRYTLWIIGKKGRFRAIAGPFEADSQGIATITAPNQTRSDALVMAYAFDDRGGAVSTTIPLNIAPE